MSDIDFSNVSKEDVYEFYKDISLKVRYYRENKNMTQLELALEIGINSVAFYSNCENSKNGKHFNLEHLYKIAKALDMNIKDFL
ncbi:helix-turn-helix transcriptional regulator [Sulfurimonas sp.]|jgi:transcriptional regulator with XRE-family HTH domain|uniref:helix-turn-helix domain-containing protein n=1 Tax=Sulfurimonas sp. TaxID=2022749 RepID=UPI0025D9B75F|nr:helix-turn-helix transcriptional regulator [Sulfurimonas sp.]MCK9473006.1 helix-turn-helix domain-containing protein [Sulfurimonas sp.]